MILSLFLGFTMEIRAEDKKDNKGDSQRLQIIYHY